MNQQPDTLLKGLLLSVCLFALLMFSSLFVGCKSYQGPDPALFPKESQEYNDGYGAGFRKGFSEGLTYNVLTQ